MTATAQRPPTPAGPGLPPSSAAGRRLSAALAGVLAAGVALGVAQLVAGLAGAASAPVIAVGDVVIAVTPEPVKDLAIRTFGTHDKLALVIGTLLLLAGCAAALGAVALTTPRAGAAGIGLFGALGAAAALTRSGAGPLAPLPSVVGAVAGVLALHALLRPLRPGPPEDDRPEENRPAEAPAPSADDDVVDRLRAVLGSGDRTRVDRRRFLLTGAVAAGATVVAGGGGLLLGRRFDVEGARAALVLPTPGSPAPPLPAGADLSRRVAGLTPLVTGPREFYRVDTALTVPQVRPAAYRLTLTGLFDAPRSYTLADLLGRDDLIERDVTLTCVSNEVGGDLAGSARWTGVPLAALLRENGIRPESSQLVCRSVDGMTIGAPTRAALDVPGAMLALGMDGRPLPVAHGFPVRMLIPGLYGYVSACKWLAGIEASTFGAFSAYWVRRGWAQQASIKTTARIDTPTPLRPVPAGRRPVAGVAWAPGRGISGVEVRVDHGDWRPAELSPAVSDDIWRQWVLPVDLAPGTHTVAARATDGDGRLQTEAREAPFPDGAAGWHTIQVTAR